VGCAPVEVGEKLPPRLPNELQNSLAAVEQGIEVDVKLGTSPASLTNSSTSALEEALKGFKITGSFTYLKKLKHILAKHDSEKL